VVKIHNNEKPGDILAFLTGMVNKLSPFIVNTSHVFILYYYIRKLTKILPNKLHGPTHCKLGGTCVYNGHLFILCCINMTI